MKLLPGLLLCLLLVAPALAQEDVPACAPDLSGVIEILEGVGATDGADAVARMAQARSRLLAAEQSCAAAGVVLLDQSYTTPDDVIALSYPHGWTVGTYTPSETGGVLFLGNSAFADRLLQVQEPEMRDGEQAMQILLGAPQPVEIATLDEVIGDFEDLIHTLYDDVSATETYELGGRPAARLAYRGASFDGVVVALALGEGRFAVARGVTGTGGLELLRAYAEAVLASVQ